MDELERDELKREKVQSEHSAENRQPDRDMAAQIPAEFEFTDEFERELQACLRVRPAPPGFAERVMARVEARVHAIEKIPAQQPQGTAKHRLLAWPRRLSPVWRAVAAVLIAAIILGGYFEHRRQRQIAGERARDQVLLALRITGTSLRAVQDQLNRTQAAADVLNSSETHLQEKK